MLCTCCVQLYTCAHNYTFPRESPNLECHSSYVTCWMLPLATCYHLYTHSILHLLKFKTLVAKQHPISTSMCICLSTHACSVTSYRRVCCPHYRRSSSGDRLSVTPDNLSPSPASSPGQIVTRTSQHVTSLLEVTTNGNGKKDGYHSSTLPLRRARNRQTADEKNKKVGRRGEKRGGWREKRGGWREEVGLREEEGRGERKRKKGMCVYIVSTAHVCTCV